MRTNSVCLRDRGSTNVRRPYRVRVSGRCHLCNFDIAHSDITISHMVINLRSIFASLLTRIPESV